jgi:hypothetical protein
MLRRCTYLFIFLLAGSFVFSQTRRVVRPAPKKPVITTPTYPRRTNLGMGVGITRSVLYLARNVKADNDATGINTTLVYGGAKLLRASLEYTFYQPLDIEPTWYNIKAQTIELNMHVMARFANKRAYFYPLFGLSYNTFSGFFTGQNDYLNLASLYKKNQQIVTRWLGLNVGTGYEYYFRPGSFFLDYKMRVGKTEGYSKINIQDVCISAGFRFNIKAPSIYSIFWYKGTRSRYLLDLEDEDD